MQYRYEDFQEAERVSSGDDLDGLVSFLINPEVTPEAKVFAIQSFRASPPSVGSCGICSASLQYEGHSDGLRVCCLGPTKHCWGMSGDRLG